MIMINFKNYFYLIIISCIIIFFSCLREEPVPTPKPFGYMRVDLPQKQYVLLDTIYPFKFKYPVYTKLVPYNGKSKEEDAKYWFNLSIPSFNAYLYFTYKEIKNKLLNEEDSEDAEKPIRNDVVINKVYPFELETIEGVDIQSKKNKLKIEIDIKKFNIDDSKSIEKYIKEIISKIL